MWDDKEPYEDWASFFQGERDLVWEDVCEELDDAYSQWLEACECPRHKCNVRIPPIDPWPTVGGVYFVVSNDRLKIGTAINIKNRLGGIQSPYPLQLLCVVPGGRTEEAAYHARFAGHRLYGEWFRICPEILNFVASVRNQECSP